MQMWRLLIDAQCVALYFANVHTNVQICKLFIDVHCAVSGKHSCKTVWKRSVFLSYPCSFICLFLLVHCCTEFYKFQ